MELDGWCISLTRGGMTGELRNVVLSACVVDGCTRLFGKASM